jgi:hypothetical protein
MHGTGLAGLFDPHAIGVDGDLFFPGFDAGGQRVRFAHAPGPRPALQLGHQGLEFGVGGLGGKQVLLASEGGFEFAGQFEPLLFGTGREVAERADDLLAGAIGSEVAFDEQVAGVGFVLVGPRGLADIHSLYTERNRVAAKVKMKSQ